MHYDLRDLSLIGFKLNKGYKNRVIVIENDDDDYDDTFECDE